MELTMKQHDHIQKICEWWFLDEYLDEKYEVIKDELTSILLGYKYEDLDEDSNGFDEDLQNLGVLQYIVEILDDYNIN